MAEIKNIPSIPELLKNQNLKRGLILLGIFLVIYLWIASWLNKVHITEKKIQQFWSILKENADRRADILPQFVQLVQDYAPQAQQITESLTKSYVQVKHADSTEQILNSSQAAATFSQAQQQVSDALFLMEKQSPNFPMLAQNNHYVMLTSYVKTLNQQMEFSVKALEQQINYYNFQLTTFPQNLINYIYPRKKPKYAIEINPSQ